METLCIKNFAGLKEVTLDIKPVTGLIGPQASGKSVIAKLLYFFREIGSRLPEAVIDGLNAEAYKVECQKRFTKYFSFDHNGTSAFRIKYSTSAEYVCVNFDPHQNQGFLALDWSNFYPSTLEKFATRKQNLFASLGESDRDVDFQQALRLEYAHEIGEVLGSWSKYEQIFIPAGRAFFSQFRESVFRNIESGESFDPFMVAFGSFLERSKSALEARGFFDSSNLTQKEFPFSQSLRSNFKKILQADLNRVDKQDFLNFDDGRRVELAQASSGQQEVLPLLLLLARFVSIKHVRGRAIYIEEPEAHLFPSAQKQVVEFIARVFRGRSNEMSLFVTTHSPYILTSLNNLLQAGKLYENASPQAVERLQKVIPRNRCFKPGEVGFYALKDGCATSILDPETGLIDAKMIDQVSNDIAIQFDNLLAEADEKP